MRLSIQTWRQLTPGFFLLHPVRIESGECRQRPGETPNPCASAFPAARAVPLHFSISKAVQNQHRHIGVGSAATAGAITIEALADIQEISEGDQSRGIGVHGRSMMPDRRRA